MGVPQLFPYIKEKFPHEIITFEKGSKLYYVDNLYIDANPLIHSAAQLVYNYGKNARLLNPYAYLSSEQKMKKTFEVFFDSIIFMIKEIMVPNILVFIAIDGPCPMAKQAQQRQRRYLANSYPEENNPNIFHLNPPSVEFDTSAITPGTPFMYELAKYMNFAIREAYHSGKFSSKLRIIYSGYKVPGEGEHKIMDYIRLIPSELKNNQTHCLYGPDADLLMLTLATHLENIILLRDNFIPEYMDIISIAEIRKGLIKFINVPEIQFDDRINDFILLGFFVGNDFIPRVPMFLYLQHGYDRILDIYLQIVKDNSYYLTLTNPKGESNKPEAFILLSTLALIINKLALIERQTLIDQALNESTRNVDDLLKNHTLIKFVKDLDPNKPRDIYIDYDGYRASYYKKAGLVVGYDDIVLSDEEVKITQMCVYYIKTLMWIFGYYINGLPSWDYYYPYDYAPLMEDLNKTIQKLVDTKDIVHTLDRAFIYQFTLGKPLSPFEQLLVVLPPTKAHYLPNPLRQLMINPVSPLKQYYPEEFEADYEGKVVEYMKVVKLPPVNKDDIIKAYNSIKLKYKYDRNEPGIIGMFYVDNNYSVTFISDYGKLEHSHVKKDVIMI